MYHPFTTIPIPCVAWWRHQMEIFSALLTPLWGESSGHRWIPPLMFPLLCIWTNGWANNRNAGDLICHRAHYDVIIMISASLMTRDRFMQWLVLTWAPTLILDTINITVFVAQDLLPSFRNVNDNNCSSRKHHMTSLNGTFYALVAFCVGEFTGHRWILRKKASDADLWCFLWSALEPTAEQILETPVIWGVIVLIMTSLLCNAYFGYSAFLHYHVMTWKRFALRDEFTGDGGFPQGISDTDLGCFDWCSTE